jgi:hypothetical protein
VLRVVSVDSELPGVFAVGVNAKGVFAFGALATGVVAIGALATGVIAIGQVARGVIAIGQGAIGVVALGQLSVGVLRSAGQLAIGGIAGPGQAVCSLFPRALLSRPQLQPQRILAWLRREPWDSVPGEFRLPAWRLAVGVTGVAGLAVGWWFAAGQALAAALF